MQHLGQPNRCRTHVPAASTRLPSGAVSCTAKWPPRTLTPAPAHINAFLYTGVVIGHKELVPDEHDRVLCTCGPGI
jgi:hypothetical protein